MRLPLFSSINLWRFYTGVDPHLQKSSALNSIGLPCGVRCIARSQAWKCSDSACVEVAPFFATMRSSVASQW